VGKKERITALKSLKKGGKSSIMKEYYNFIIIILFSQ